MQVAYISPYYHNIWESLGVAYIHAYCKQFIPDLHGRFFQENFDPLERIVRLSKDVDIVAVSATSPTYKNGLLIAKAIKKVNKNVHVVFGGFHVSGIYQYEPFDSVIDQVVIGEGEEGFLRILNGDTEKYIFSKNLTFEEIGVWPDRKLIRQGRQLDYNFKGWNERKGHFQSRRGCNHKCLMCAEHSISGQYSNKTNPIRLRNNDDTLNEIESVYNTYNIDRFNFVDATWCYPKKHALEFCNKKIERGNLLPWECMAHASFLDEEILVSLKKSNCSSIAIGVESGSQRILNIIGKGVTRDKIEKVFKLGKKIGIKMRAFCIVGIPEETKYDVTDTFDLIEELDPDVTGMTILCPYPGTAYYNHKKYKNIDWSKADEYSNDFWKTLYFNNSDLKIIQSIFMNRFKDKICWHQRELSNG